MILPPKYFFGQIIYFNLAPVFTSSKNAIIAGGVSLSFSNDAAQIIPCDSKPFIFPS